ncbi:MAG: hypothetical protein ABR534_00920 [Desulfotignum sp.]|nr:hypothetical protein [Desulfobacteraceae bacterium]
MNTLSHQTALETGVSKGIGQAETIQFDVTIQGRLCERPVIGVNGGMV